MAEKNLGWAAVHRSTTRHWLWKDKPFARGQAWIDMILEANHSDQKVLIGSTLHECRRGQSLNSVKTWALRWGWSESAVRRFFKLLETDGMIEAKATSKTTIVTICNYELYQDLRRASDEQVTNKRRASDEQVTTNNNVNNENHENNGNNENNLDGETDRPARPEGDAGFSVASPEHVYLNSLERVDFEHMKGWRMHEIERVEEVATHFGRMYLHRFERPHHPIKRDAWELATSKLRATLMSGVAEVVEWEDVIEQYLSEWNGESPTTGEKRNPNFEAFCGPRMITNLINHMSEER